MEEEYRKRVAEQKRLIAAYNAQNLYYPIDVIEGDYETEAFYQIAKGLEQCHEGGERCFACYELRLRKTAQLAADMGADYFKMRIRDSGTCEEYRAVQRAFVTKCRGQAGGIG